MERVPYVIQYNNIVWTYCVHVRVQELIYDHPKHPKKVSIRTHVCNSKIWLLFLFFDCVHFSFLLFRLFLFFTIPDRWWSPDKGNDTETVVWLQVNKVKEIGLRKLRLLTTQKNILKAQQLLLIIVNKIPISKCCALKIVTSFVNYPPVLTVRLKDKYTIRK
jgi:hypothetical protein